MFPIHFSARINFSNFDCLALWYTKFTYIWQYYQTSAFSVPLARFFRYVNWMLIAQTCSVGSMRVVNKITHFPTALPIQHVDYTLPFPTVSNRTRSLSYSSLNNNSFFRKASPRDKEKHQPRNEDHVLRSRISKPDRRHRFP